ncbi:hypothetical protein KY334_02380 [Candidatus Woesearchaeota archaeon]|nr:hypothetical protein [Candidatus Woesearchaeota archaeon]
MSKSGNGLIFILMAILSFVLPAMGRQFVILMWMGSYFWIGSLLLALIGVSLIASD